MGSEMCIRDRKITGGKVYLRIISNLADKRLVRARTVVNKEELGGRDLVEGIVTAWALAEVDPYRAATHNKGIMNGVIAVALATAPSNMSVMPTAIIAKTPIIGCLT